MVLFFPNLKAEFNVYFLVKVIPYFNKQKFLQCWKICWNIVLCLKKKMKGVITGLESWTEGCKLGIFITNQDHVQKNDQIYLITKLNFTGYLLWYSLSQYMPNNIIKKTSGITFNNN